MRLSPFGDCGPDAALPQEPTVLVVAVTAVGEEHVSLTPRPARGEALLPSLFEPDRRGLVIG
jgi:hypothetical protein